MQSLMVPELAVPLSHIALLLTFSTGALLLGRVKLALLINYLFALHWGYIYNQQLFVVTDIEAPRSKLRGASTVRKFVIL